MKSTEPEVNGMCVLFVYHSKEYQKIFYKIFKLEAYMFQNGCCSSSLDLSTADYDSEFPVIKTLKWGLKIEQQPLLSSLSGSIRSTATMVWTRQCFSNGKNAFKCGWTFYIHGFNIIRSFLRLPRHTSIRPDTPKLCPLIKCSLLCWTSANIISVLNWS